MKRNVLVLGALFLTNAAFACVSHGDLTLCPGDMVVVGNADGRVLAINPTNNQVSVDFSVGKSQYSGINTYALESVSLEKGCSGQFCVGDKVYVGNGDGLLIAINPWNDQAVVDFSVGKSSYTGISTYSVDSLVSTQGCIKGYCIGETVYVGNADGQIVGIDRRQDQITVDFSTGKSAYAGTNTYSVESASIGKGCLKGYCVGDWVVVQDGDGIIVGVNPFNDQATVDFSVGKSQYAGVNSYDLDSLAVTNYCVDYDEQNVLRATPGSDEFEKAFSRR